MEKNTNSIISRLSRNFNTFNYTKRATEQTDTESLTEFDDVYTSSVSPGPSYLMLGLTQQPAEYRQQYCTVDHDGACCHGRNPC